MLVAALVAGACTREQSGTVPMPIYGNVVVGYTESTEPMFARQSDPPPFPLVNGRIALTVAADTEPSAAGPLRRGIERPLAQPDREAAARCAGRPRCYEVVPEDDPHLDLVAVARAARDGELWQVDLAVHDASEREGPPLYRVRLYDADLYAAIGVAGALLLPPSRQVQVGERPVRTPRYARQIVGVTRGTATVMDW